MRISDWSSDMCSSDLRGSELGIRAQASQSRTDVSSQSRSVQPYIAETRLATLSLDAFGAGHGFKEDAGTSCCLIVLAGLQFGGRPVYREDHRQTDRHEKNQHKRYLAPDHPDDGDEQHNERQVGDRKQGRRWEEHPPR